MFKKLLLSAGLLAGFYLAGPAYAQPVAADIENPTADTSTSDLSALLTAPNLSVAGIKVNREDLVRFYAARNDQPCWDYGGPAHAAVFLQFITSLTKIIEDQGLRPESFPLGTLRGLAARPDPESRRDLELLITDSLLRLAHELHGDDHRLDKLYTGWTFEREPVDIPAAMAAVVATDGLNEFIDGLLPNRPAYRQLVKALALYRGLAAQGGWAGILPGPSLHPGDQGQRVRQLQARLVVEDYMTAQPSGRYDEATQRAVSSYQLANGLEADGTTGKATLAALNVPIAARIDQITANLERWRHIPDSYPSGRYIAVNVPANEVVVVDDKTVVYRGPVISGRVDRPTPFIASEIASLIVNPVWHVPTSIAEKDILPKMQKDPHYLQKQGITITDADGNPVDRVDADELAHGGYKFRQESGDMNSLGRVKFDFPNDFAVYMHGTPHQDLFGKTQRALSSGCVRLRDPAAVAALLLKDTFGDWSEAKIQQSIDADDTKRIALAQPMPIYILYWTVFADDAGKLNFRPDVYGYDQALAPMADRAAMPVVEPPVGD